MTKRIRHVVLVFVAYAGVALIVTGCGISTSVSSSTSGITFGCTPNTNNTSGNLEGTWTAPCTVYQYSGSSPSEWYQDTLVFSGSSATETMAYYDESSCGAAAELYQIVTLSTFATGGSASQNGFNDLTFTVSSVSITPENSDQASTWNGSSFCGLTSWTSGTSTSVTGNSNTGCVYPSSGTTRYQMYGLGNQSDGGLSCGTPINGVAFGFGSNMSTVTGVILGGGSSSYPTSSWGVIFN